MPCTVLKAHSSIFAMCTGLDDSNPLESSCSSPSAVVEQTEGSTTVDDMVEATEETPPPQSKEKVSSLQSGDDQGMY